MSLENSPARDGAVGLRPLTVTVPTALALTGIGRTKLYALIAEGKVKAVKVGSRTLVNFASLEALTATGQAA
jgi:excisionase family DNA binding protein